MIKFYIALIASKIAYIALKILKRNGSFYPGYIATKINKDFLKIANKPKYVICVTGTDGKTTTANLISDTLTNCGYKVANNKVGSNTNIGITTAVINSINIFNKTKVDCLVLETDEHYVRLIAPVVKCDYLIVTNVIRDSLQRNAHPTYVFNKINMCEYKDMTVILNADEINSSQLLKDCKSIYYGISQLPNDYENCINIINDHQLCPKCDTKMDINYVRYNHIGKITCPNCNFSNPEPNYKLTNINYNKKQITINNKEYHLINDGIFNIYNQLALITLLDNMKIEKDIINQALKNTNIIKTRFKEEKFKNKTIISTMVKSNNSLPASLVFDYIRNKNTTKCLIFAFDDLDEKDSMERIGWIYDADYEFLTNVDQIICTGIRHNDHHLRLLLAGIDDKKIISHKEIKEAIKDINLKVETFFILHDTSFTVKENIEKVKYIEGQVKMLLDGDNYEN